MSFYTRLTIIERRNLQDIGLIAVVSALYGGFGLYGAIIVSWFGNW